MSSLLRLIGASRVANISIANGMFNLAEQHVQKKSNAWPNNTPVYNVSVNTTQINEGQSFTISVATRNLRDGNVLYWNNYGNTSALDYSPSFANGTLTVQTYASGGMPNNVEGFANVTISLSSDATTEGNEYANIAISASDGGPILGWANVLIIDTSQSPPPGDYMQFVLVAGGGGGGSQGNGGGSGGGGAGGFLCGNITSLAPSLNRWNPVTIGAGGGQANNGSNSTFGGNTGITAVTSCGGGAGGSGRISGGSNGGSGGGGGGRTDPPGPGFGGGTGTPGQGTPGGQGYHVGGTYISGGGGGGGSVSGTSADQFNNPMNGGAGCQTSILGVSLYFAGGGGGGGHYGSATAGDGGLGGGGGGGGNARGGIGGGCSICTGSNGTQSGGTAPGGAGAPNTGGGGGGAGGSSVGNGAAGGSGILILNMASTRSATVTAGLTISAANTAVPSRKIYCITGGTGCVCFS